MNRLEKLRQLLESGELSSRAAASANMDVFLDGLGLSRKQWQEARSALTARGVCVPTIAELRAQGREKHQPKVDVFPGGPEFGQPIVDVFTDFDNEEATQPGIEHVPPGHYVRGQSTLEDGAGNVMLRWVKTATSQQQHLEQIIESVRELGPTLPRAAPIPPPVYSDDDLLAVFGIGDAHLGALAWGPECGENHDLTIAENDLSAAIDHLTALAPPAKRALIINVGDFVHADSPANTTTKGTRVDVDGRWPKIINAAIRALRRHVDRCLEKHEHVTLWNLRGNHDDLSAMVLSIALGQFYEHEPRVEVCQSPQMFKWYRFGQCLIGSTHGEKLKAQDLLGVMACDRARDWGETQHRRIYCGHYHHEMVKEVPGLIVEYLRSLTGSDAWHHGKGYRAGRSMCVDTWHERWGHINRHIVGIQQLRAA